MTKPITVLVHCDKPHEFTPGVCLACERDALRERVAELEQTNQKCAKWVFDLTADRDQWKARAEAAEATVDALRLKYCPREMTTTQCEEQP